MLKCIKLGVLIVATSILASGAFAQQSSADNQSTVLQNNPALSAFAKRVKPRRAKCEHIPICQVCCYDPNGTYRRCRFDTRLCGQ